MSIRAYSYVFKQEVLLLNEEEFRPIEHAVSQIRSDLKSYRNENAVSGLKTAMKESEEGQLVLRLCEELAGVRPYHPFGAGDLLISKYGRICNKCDKPFRSPRAKFCAECGFTLPEGEVAGPLTDG